MHTKKSDTNASYSGRARGQGPAACPEVSVSPFTRHCGKHSQWNIFLRDCALTHGRKAPRGQSIPSEALAENLCLFRAFRPVPSLFTQMGRSASFVPYLHLRVVDHPSPEHSRRRDAVACRARGAGRASGRRRLGGWRAVAPGGGG